MPSPLLVAHTHLLLLHMIRKRHFIRIVCLPNEKQISTFAIYLQQVVGDDEYGKGVAFGGGGQALLDINPPV